MQAGAFYGLRNNNVTKTPSPEIMNKIVVSSTEKLTSKDGSCSATPRESTVEVETRWTGEGIEIMWTRIVYQHILGDAAAKRKSS